MLFYSNLIHIFPWVWFFLRRGTVKVLFPCKSRYGFRSDICQTWVYKLSERTVSGLSIQLNIKGNIQDMSDIALMTNGASWLAEGGGGGGGDQSGVGDGRALWQTRSKWRPSFLSQPREIVKLPDKLLDEHEDIGQRYKGCQGERGTAECWQERDGEWWCLCFSYYFNL